MREMREMRAEGGKIQLIDSVLGQRRCRSFSDYEYLFCTVQYYIRQTGS